MRTASFPKPVGNGVPDANPLQTDALALNDEHAYRFTGGATLNWNAMAGERSSLRIVGAAGADFFEQKNRVHTPNELFFEVPQNQPGTAVDGNAVSQYFNWNLNSIWNWRPGSLNSTLSFGVQYEDRELRVSSVTTNNLVPGQGNVNQGTNFIVTDSLGEERTLALYAQEEVRLLEDKLLIQGGLRAERSSVNGDDAKYYVFPKASASYRFENLVGDGSEVKLRAAYGATGNQPVFGQKYTLVNTPQVGGRNGFTVAGQAGSPIVEPEELREVEGGVDASFANGRIVFEGTLYYRTTENLLLTRVPAPSSGFTGQIFNGGRIENKGIELGLGVTPVQSEQDDLGFPRDLHRQPEPGARPSGASVPSAPVGLRRPRRHVHPGRRAAHPARRLCLRTRRRSNRHPGKDRRYRAGLPDGLRQ